jgi:AraC-like DNA-binding protein
MAVLVDTTKLPAARREQIVQDVLYDTVAPVNVRFRCALGKVSYLMEYWQLGEAEVIRASGFGSLHLARTPRHVRQHASPLVVFSFQLRGSGVQTQNDRTCDTAPGDLSVLDFSRPFSVGLSETASTGAVIVPTEDLDLPADVIQRAASVLPGSPVYGLLRDHLVRLSRDAGKIADPRHAAMTGRATIELARALIASAGQDDLRGNDAWHETLRTRLTVYLEHHLTDPGLCASELARAHHISVRQLYKVWAQGELSLSQWIIRERLEGARRDLSSAAGSGLTIAALARRWGFASTTHFSRRFREAYGASPREWRQRQAAPPGT